MMTRNIGRLYVVLVSSFILMVIIGVSLYNRKMHYHVDARHMNHITGVIGKIQDERSSAFVRLKDGRRIFFFDSDNYNYSPFALNKFLKVGDSIVKADQSDTLFIFRVC